MNPRWISAFLRSFSPPPADYIVFDCETTGLGVSTDLPLEIGHTVVRDGKIANQASFYLDWTKHPDVELAWLADRIATLDEHFRKNGQPLAVTLDTLRRKGVDPVKVLKFYFTLFRDNRTSGGKLVGQNVVNFDSKLLTHVFRHFLGRQWQPAPDELYDTFSIAKAAETCFLPNDRESLLEYMRRASRCWGKRRSYKLEKIASDYGVLPTGDAPFHSAEFDAYVTYLVFEHQRERIVSAAGALQ